MELRITFPGGKRVEAELDGRRILTDQPVSAGGDGSAPSPFELFVASLATCAGYYVLAFCQEGGIATDRIVLRQKSDFPSPGTAKCVVPTWISGYSSLPASRKSTGTQWSCRPMSVL